MSQGKVSEKSGNLDMDIEWQPWPVDKNWTLDRLMSCTIVKRKVFLLCPVKTDQPGYLQSLIRLNCPHEEC